MVFWTSRLGRVNFFWSDFSERKTRSSYSFGFLISNEIPSCPEEGIVSWQKIRMKAVVIVYRMDRIFRDNLILINWNSKVLVWNMTGNFYIDFWFINERFLNQIVPDNFRINKKISTRKYTIFLTALISGNVNESNSHLLPLTP